MLNSNDTCSSCPFSSLHCLNHDTLVYRLAQMLVKLNPQALADEFGVNLRTIQRDLNVRFAYLPLQKTDGYYHLDPTFLGKLSIKEVDRFAGLAGVRGLFPSLSDNSVIVAAVSSATASPYPQPMTVSRSKRLTYQAPGYEGTVTCRTSSIHCLNR